jgi:membrane protease YdiL (CAAX protease family)
MEPETYSSTNSYPTLGQSVALMAIFLAINIIVALLGLILVGEATASTSWMTLISYVLSFGLTISLALLIRNRQAQSAGSFNVRSIPGKFYPVLVLITLTVSILVEPLTEPIPVPAWLEGILLKLLLDKSFAMFVLMVIAAPILEELLFRGIILEGFLKNYNPWKAIIWSSLLFGLAHLNPWQFIAAFFVGLIIGWLYLKTQSLVPGIFMHFVANLFGYSLRFFISPENALSSTRQWLGSLGFYIVFLVLCLAIFILLIRTLQNWLADQTQQRVLPQTPENYVQ